jgi:hypothetical protein
MFLFRERCLYDASNEKSEKSKNKFRMICLIHLAYTELILSSNARSCKKMMFTCARVRTKKQKFNHGMIYVEEEVETFFSSFLCLMQKGCCAFSRKMRNPIHG